MANQQHHYYGSTAFGWRVGDTREQVVKDLARDAGNSIIRRCLKNGGLYAWTCRVELPKSAEYQIDGYRPVGVPSGEREEHYIVSVTGKTRPKDG